MNRTFLHLVAVILGAIVTANGASAQHIEQMRGRLGTRSHDGATIDIVEDRSTRNAISSVEAIGKGDAVSGYRVVIFYDDAQYAQDRANKILESFNKEYPEINSYIVYEKPYFKVSVGDCLSAEEALILRNKLIGKYSGAFTRRDNINLQELSNVRRRADCLQLDPKVRDSLLYHRSFRDEMRKDETYYIVMQRDSALNHLLILDDLSDKQNEKVEHQTTDPDWITEW